jgi:hypothetical protein
VGNQPHIFVAIYFVSVGRGNSAALLPAVLEREQAVKRQAANVQVFAVDAKDSAFFSQVFHNHFLLNTKVAKNTKLKILRWWRLSSSGEFVMSTAAGCGG